VENKPKENDNQALMAKALVEIKKLQQKIKSTEAEKNEPIAIVGLSCRFPGSVVDADSFWDLLKNGKDAITKVPSDRWNSETFYDKDPNAKGKIYTKSGGFIDDVEGFDYSFFGITPIEAKRIDPQQRLLMELSWEALENANYIPSQLSGSKTGVFVGISGNDYLQLQTKQLPLEDIDPYFTTGWAHSVASGRISYSFGFEGPSMAVDTACSSSLVAVDLACQHLRTGSCDLALACGVSLMLSPEVSINFSKAKMLSIDGRCKSFDADANGYVRGEGGGVVILKKLVDAIKNNDQILAVINGSAVNQDGRSGGLTVPNGPSQERVIKDALKMAQLKPEDISYIEAHGTGTSLGDPIEANALGNVLGGQRPNKFLIGSVKTNFGHLEAAAGMASLIKTVLCLQKRTLVPTLHFQKINPHIEIDKIPMEVVTKITPWGKSKEALHAGISSFGFSGTNAHLIISNYSPVNNDSIEKEPVALPSSFLVKISGQTLESANAQKEIFKKILEDPTIKFSDFSHSVNTYKSDFKFKKYLIAKSKEDILKKLEALAFDETDEYKTNQSRVAFLFTGQGSQYPQMGKELYLSQSVYKNAFEECAKLFQKSLGIDLTQLVYGENSNSEDLQKTINTQPVLFAVEYALANMWMQWGVRPSLVLGHSVGEIVAACIAGVFTLADAVKLVSARSKSIQETSAIGGMIAIALEEESVKKLLLPYKNLSIAAVNAESSIVVSGDLKEIDSLEISCNNEKIRNKKLQVSHAFHSALLKDMVRPFRKEIETINFMPPQIKFISNVTGLAVTANEITNPDYWCKHVLSTVRFYDSVKEVEKNNANFILEIGGQGVLTELCKKTIKSKNVYFGGSIKERSTDWEEINECIGKLFFVGVPIKFAEIYKPYNLQKVNCGLYPFHKTKTWFKDRTQVTSQDTILEKIQGDIKNYQGQIENFDNCHQLVDQYASYLLWSLFKPLIQKNNNEEKLIKAIQVQEKYLRLHNTLLQILLQAAFIEKSGGQTFAITEKGNSSETSERLKNLTIEKNNIISKFNDSKYMFALLHACVENLLPVLSGKIKSVEAMFPNGDVSMVENVYKKNEILKVYSQLVAEAVKAFVENKTKEKSGQTIRILEIGAGTGGTSAFVFEALEGLTSNLHYCYTDISGGFLQHGKLSYGKNRPYIEFKALDIERDLQPQNFALGSYDIVFASNVIHATKQIKNTITNAQTLLKKGGMLLLNETTKVLTFTSLTFGLADGWWLYEDENIRLPNAPLLSASQWQTIFSENQFVDVKAIGCQLEKHEAFQHLIYGVSAKEIQAPKFKEKILTPTQESRNIVKIPRATILAKIQEITKEASGIEIFDLKPDVNLFELGLDSLMLMAMKDRIEKEFSVVMDTSLFYSEADTLKKISEYIEQHTAIPVASASIMSLVQVENSEGLQGFFQKQELLMKSFFDQQLKALEQQLPQNKNNTPQAPIVRSTGRPHLRGFKFEKDVLTAQQQSFVDGFIKRYNKRTMQSKQYAADSKNNCADWINSLGFRITLKELAYPVVMDHCFGSKFVDLDGNEYVDYAMGYGVGFFGNNVDFIKDGIQKQLDKGFELGPQNHLIGKVSALISEMTKVDRVSYCNSGTEAIMVALRLARTATKRQKIVFFSGSYHGTFDGILAFPSQNGYGAEPQVIGTPDAMMADIMILPYGDEKSLDIIKGLGSQLAGVLVEPVQSRNPSLQPKEFLQKLRALTTEMGAVLIFDEVLLGFRICQGGAQKYFGITADIVTYGKIVGGGMPIGVVSGKKEILDLVDGGVWNFGDQSAPRPETTVFQGTFCKHPLAMAAAFAVLTKMKTEGPKLQEQVNQLTDYLALQINRFFEKEKLPIKLSHFGSVFKFDTAGRLNFLLQPIEMDLFYLLLMEKGVYTWEKRICFLSTAHTQNDIDLLIQKIKETVHELKANGFLNDFSGPDKTLALESTEASFVASTVQKRLYSLKAFDEGKSPYQLTAAYTIMGQLNLEKLQNAIQRVYMRHPLLRARFEVEKDGEIYLKFRDDFQFKLSVIASNGLSIDQLIEKTEMELDLVTGPSFKVSLYELKKDSYLIVFTTHHCVIDGLSWDLFIQDFVAQLELKESFPIQSKYQDFITWQKNYFLSESYKIDKEFWLHQFSNEIPLLELPSDFSRPVRKSGKGGIVFGSLDASLVNSLKAVAKKNACTINMLLLSIYSVFLQKLSGQNSIVIGMPISGRPSKEFENTIGMFANSIALPLLIENEDSLTNYITQVKDKTLKAYQHQAYPFERLVEHVVTSRDLSRNPIFDTMFVFEKGQKRVLKTTEFDFQSYPIKKDISPYDLTLEVIEQNGEMSFNFEFNADIFKYDTMKQWQSYLLNLLQEMVQHPNLTIGSYQLWNSSAQSLFLEKVNQKEIDFGGPTTLTKLFGQALKQNNDRVFTINKNEIRNYQQVEKLANGVASFILAKKIKSPNIVVHIEKSDNYIPIILGIMKAGACFIPVESKFTAERLQTIIDDCQAGLIIIDESLKFKINQADNVFTPKEILSASGVFVDYAKPDQPAYIIYTSGSTGKPKGVVVLHQSICNSMIWRSQFYKLQPHDSVLQLASYSFDSSLAEILPTMIAGGSIVFFDENDRLDIDHLSQLIETHKVTCLTLTASFYDAFLSYLSVDDSLHRMKSIKNITLAGEETSLSLLQKHLDIFPAIKLFNEYGPTENSICGTIYPFEPGKISIGKPISNNQLFVWSTCNQLCPPGVIGQIVLSGLGITEGYLNRPELTAKSFHNIHGKKFYFTGDLGTWDQDGNLFFKGRIDDQVKIRGYRIELGEIKAKLDQIPAIKDSVLHIYQDTNGKSIVAYYVKKDEISQEDIKENLLKSLPPYMVPAYFVALDNIPFNNSGKVNKKALPLPVKIENDEVKAENPSNEKETDIAEVWSQVLNRSSIGIRENYFHLGGDSIKAIQVMGKLAGKGYSMKVPDLFENPTIFQLAQVIKRLDTNSLINYQKAETIGSYSLTPIQKWFLQNTNAAKNHFNQSVLLEFKEKLNELVLQEAAQCIFEKHSVLRSTFTMDNKEIQGVIPEVQGSVVLEKTKFRTQDELVAHIQRLQRSFVLDSQPLIKFSYISLGQQELVFITAHHLVVDVISWRIILEDLATFYQSISSSKAIERATFFQHIPFRKWSELIQAYAFTDHLFAQKEYWQSVENKISLGQLPKEVSNQKITDITTIHLELPEETSGQLVTNANKSFNTDVNDLLMVALARTTQALYQMNIVAVDVELHGRQGIDLATPDLNHTVGWFTSLYPICLEVNEQNDLGYQIKDIKEQIRAIPQKGFGYGVLKYISEQIEGDATPSIALNYLGDLDGGFENEVFKLLPDKDFNNVSNDRYLDHAIELELYQQNKKLNIKAHYRGQGTPKDWMIQFAEKFRTELTNIINHCINQESTELTPGDLTYKGLSIDDLDNLFE
jgi:amino acid adenylation domain-containing protein/non-ribosomal peptide synthase protein (TIGR01720 family)